MARKKAEPKKTAKPNNNAYIEGAGLVADEKITMSLEKNYMPYAMSVLVSRAFPEIDGFKPSHRKLLYTMYKMGLLNGKLTKSANIVGATMRLNPHGDGAIYETMVRLSQGNEALLYSTRNGPASAITCNDRINTTFYHLFAGYKSYL